MLRIRKLYDNVLPRNKVAVAHAQAIIASQFPLVSQDEIAALPDKLRDPMKHRLQSILFVAEDHLDQVKGAAFVFHEPELRFCYLDYICTTSKMMGRGIIGTAYETPVHADTDNPPYLLYDDLGMNVSLSGSRARKIVRAILEKKYGELCSPEYISMVVNSFQDDPVRLRPYVYTKGEHHPPAVPTSIPADERISLVVNEKHEIHHIHERGYVESPVRIKTILKEILPTGLFEPVPRKHFSLRHIQSIHNRNFVAYLKKVCDLIPADRSVYPYVFPIRNIARPPKELPIRAGYYCIDTFTPLNINAYPAARGAVDCALTAAGED
ncbi:MAG: hypothetical protein WA133_05670 [Syntrophales bacterium]